MANVGEQGSGALASVHMASLPGMVRITLKQYADSLALALGCSGIGSQAVLPLLESELLREFDCDELKLRLSGSERAFIRNVLTAIVRHTRAPPPDHRHASLP